MISSRFRGEAVREQGSFAAGSRSSRYLVSRSSGNAQMRRFLRGDNYGLSLRLTFPSEAQGCLVAALYSQRVYLDCDWFPCAHRTRVNLRTQDYRARSAT